MPDFSKSDVPCVVSPPEFLFYQVSDRLVTSEKQTRKGTALRRSATAKKNKLRPSAFYTFLTEAIDLPVSVR